MTLCLFVYVPSCSKKDFRQMVFITWLSEHSKVLELRQSSPQT